MLSLLSEVNAAVWKHSRVRQLYRHTLMTDFAQAFQNNQNNISDAVNYLKLRIKRFLLEIWRFHHSFLMRYFKMRIKTG